MSSKKKYNIDKVFPIRSMNHIIVHMNENEWFETTWANRGNAKVVSDGMGGTIYNIPYANAGYNTGYVNFG